MDGVIADLELFVGQPQRQEDADHLQDDERGNRRVADHPARSLGLPAQQCPVTMNDTFDTRDVGRAAEAGVLDYVRIGQHAYQQPAAQASHAVRVHHPQGVVDGSEQRRPAEEADRHPNER